MGAMANSEDPDEVPHKAAFYQHLHCLLGQNGSSQREKYISLEIITYNPSIYTMNHPGVSASNFIENSFGLGPLSAKKKMHLKMSSAEVVCCK